MPKPPEALTDYLAYTAQKAEDDECVNWQQSEDCAEAKEIHAGIKVLENLHPEVVLTQLRMVSVPIIATKDMKLTAKGMYKQRQYVVVEDEETDEAFLKTMDGQEDSENNQQNYSGTLSNE